MCVFVPVLSLKALSACSNLGVVGSAFCRSLFVVVICVGEKRVAKCDSRSPSVHASVVVGVINVRPDIMWNIT